ncbi:MAG TPA: transcription termination factor Rho [Candidatus Polarisedimenticolia bacterium]
MAAPVDGAPGATPVTPQTAASLEARGVLEVAGDGGFLRQPQRSYRSSTDDIFVPRDLLNKLGVPDPRGNGSGLEGCEIEGMAAPAGGGPNARGGHRAHGGGRGGGSARLVEMRTVNGLSPQEFAMRRPFSQLTSIDPFERIKLETEPTELSMRVIDLLAPIGKGQRCLIVAPPRAGKTTLLQRMAAAITLNHPEIHLIVLLVDERPEEVTDMKRSVRGEVIASSSDDVARNHVSVARIVLERARRLVEVGRDVVILLDSVTRLARAHNTATPGTGRTLSGGLDARTMEQPRRLFGAARKSEEGGSLTVIATALVDTGSRMDDVIFQEFKGTGNMELVLDRALFEQRIYPALDIARSGTRKEEKLFPKEDLPRIHRLRRVLFEMKPHDAMIKLLDKLAKYPTNAAFLKALDT